jgi:hypothetical protein
MDLHFTWICIDSRILPHSTCYPYFHGQRNGIKACLPSWGSVPASIWHFADVVTRGSPAEWYGSKHSTNIHLMISRLSLAESIGGLLGPFFVPYDPGSVKKFWITSADQQITQAVRPMPSPVLCRTWVWLLSYSESLLPPPITLTK